MIAYTRSGQGSNAVVLIHGFGEDSSIWNSLRSLLEPHYTLVIPDLPGTGNSEPAEQLSIEQMAVAIASVLEKEKLSKATILGHSMGGYIALAFAELFADKLSALGLIHSTAFADTETKLEARRKSIKFIEKHGAKAFLDSSTPNLFAEANRESMAHTITQQAASAHYISNEALIAFTKAMMARPDRTDILKTAEFPVLFILGREDQAVPFNDTMQQVYLPELSYIYILDKSGHMGMLEEPSLFQKAVQEFLTETTR